MPVMYTVALFGAVLHCTALGLTSWCGRQSWGSARGGESALGVVGAAGWPCSPAAAAWAGRRLAEPGRGASTWPCTPSQHARDVYMHACMHHPASPRPELAGLLAGWAHACCTACLALTTPACPTTTTPPSRPPRPPPPRSTTVLAPTFAGRRRPSSSRSRVRTGPGFRGAGLQGSGLQGAGCKAEAPTRAWVW